MTNDYIEKEVTVGELRDMFNSGEYDIEVESPDGYVGITHWHDKGVLDMVEVILDNGMKTLCSTNHMIQVDGDGVVPENGNQNYKWKFAEHLVNGDMVYTTSGTSKVVSVTEKDPTECYDFTVDHENHRYFADGISSHNSGKSFIVSGNIVREAQKQGIFVILIDTENALDESWLHALGVETTEDKMLRISASMIDDVAKIMSDFMKSYKVDYGHLDREQRPKVLFVIDSLGMLMTPTDVDQFQKGEMKGDMGRKPKALKALVTNITNMFGDNDVGLVMTNHSYASQDMFDPDPKISGGCLIAGTEVIMGDGTMKAIEKIQIGDEVRTKTGVAHKVTKTWHYVKPTFEILLAGGDKIKCSPEHKFSVGTGFHSGEWREAKDLKVGDTLRYANGTQTHIIVITEDDVETDVYDIEVETAHHYLLKDGLLSHNSGVVYAASLVVAMQKRKLKEDDQGNKIADVTGIRSAIKIMKSRYSKPFEGMELKIPYSTGMSPYSGMVSLFEQHGYLVQEGTRLTWSRNGTDTPTKMFRKAYERNEDGILDKMMVGFQQYMDEKYPAVNFNDVDTDADIELHVEDVTLSKVESEV